jgi:diacylglycerol kinase (ATP)
MAVGGDGTVHEVLNGVMRTATRPSVGIVPVGGGNDLARGLRLSSTVAKATRAAWDDCASPIDVGLCNDRYFFNVGGVGLDTTVAQAVNRKRGRFAHGKIGYIAQALVELSRYDNQEYTLQLDGREVASRSLLIAVANGRYFAGGMKICPQADPADGWLDVCIGGDLTRLETLGLMPAIYGGWHGRHRKVTFHRVRSVRIDGPGGAAVQLDGELSASLPAEFSLLPDALRIVGWQGSCSQSH